MMDPTICENKLLTLWKQDNNHSPNISPIFENPCFHSLEKLEYPFDKLIKQMNIEKPNTENGFRLEIEKIELFNNSSLKTKYKKRQQELINFNEKILYHGTPPENISSICKNGFDISLIEKEMGGMGGIYGRGIYLCDRISESRIYGFKKDYKRTSTRGQVIVCQVSVGKSKDVTRGNNTINDESKSFYGHNPLTVGYNTHYANRKTDYRTIIDKKVTVYKDIVTEYVIDDTTQILPFCILHLYAPLPKI